MADITYHSGTSDIVTHGTTYLATIATWCCQFAEGARDGQQIAARYNELSRLSGPSSCETRPDATDDYARSFDWPLRFQPDFC